jgi:hypothetical protein
MVLREDPSFQFRNDRETIVRTINSAIVQTERSVCVSAPGVHELEPHC